VVTKSFILSFFEEVKNGYRKLILKKCNACFAFQIQNFTFALRFLKEVCIKDCIAW